METTDTPIEETAAAVTATVTEPEKPAVHELTAKQMAAAEELNGLRLRQQAEANAIRAEQATAVEPTVIELAAQGIEALHEGLRQHANRKPPEYVPPPRTERQMFALQEELEAGRKAQQRAEAQQASRVVEQVDGNKEGFTTPVYRPANMVPDPIKGGMGPIVER